MAAKLTVSQENLNHLTILIANGGYPKLDSVTKMLDHVLKEHRKLNPTTLITGSKQHV